MDLIDRVRRTIRDHALAGPSTRVLVALSGGADSVALACLLKDLAEAGELALAGVAHFNHQLRPEADRDEQFCRELAEALELAFAADREPVGARAREERTSVETAARTARYAFLERAADQMQADAVALGHTRDDQAETFLLRLLRGAGARGVAAMHPRRGRFVRPLLECRRADLRAFLASRGTAWVEDLTNSDCAIPRNRVRAELMPLLEARFNPAVVDALADAADLARAEWAWMNAEADRVADEAVRQDGATWRIHVPVTAGLPPALARVLIRRALTGAAGGRPVSYEHVEAVRRLCEGGGPVDLPGCRAHLFGSDIVLTGRRGEGGGRPSQPSSNFFSYSLSIPGDVVVAEAGWVVSAELVTDKSVVEEKVAVRSGTAVAVRLDRCGTELAVRNRRPGDRFRPVGLGGRKKLQDFFVDRKVPRAGRDLVPLVVDSRDRIVWVAGHALDDEFRVTDPAQAVLVLRLKPVGGTA